MRPRHGSLLRCTAEDVDGRQVGRVVGTAPQDGGGEPDLVLVHMPGRYGHLRWVTLAGASCGEGRIRLPVARRDIDDAPSAEDTRWGDPTDVARSFWRAVAD